MFSVGQLFNRFFFSSTFWAMDKRQKNSSWIYHWLWYYLFVQYLTCDTYKSVDDLAMALRPSNILLNAFSSCLLLVYLSLLIFNIVFTEHETVLSANKYIGKKWQHFIGASATIFLRIEQPWHICLCTKHLIENRCLVGGSILAREINFQLLKILFTFYSLIFFLLILCCNNSLKLN